MKHHLKLIYRNFRKNISINLINLGGLSLSMAIVLMLAAYCYSELTTDWHHENVDQTYILAIEESSTNLGVFTPAILSDHLRSEVPEIEQVIRMCGTWGKTAIKIENGSVYDLEMVFAGKDFFKLLKYTIIAGNLENALVQPMSMVLIKSEAIRLFGHTNVIGETVTINNEHLMEITAVIEAPSNNSFLSIKALVSMSSKPIIQPNGEEFTSWGYNNFQTFIKTNQNVDSNDLQERIKNIYASNSGMTGEQTNILLLSIKDVYFSNIDNSIIGYTQIGDFSKIQILLIVACIILGIALINYVNISSFSLKERLKQTGLFKIIGATRQQILWNLILENMLLFFLAIWIAILLSEVLKLYISDFTGVSYYSGLLISPWFILTSVGLALIIGFVTNISTYVKHSFTRPMSDLKKEIIQSGKGRLYQRYLVILQFSAAIVLIVFTVLVQKQVNFSTSGLGFNDQNIVTIRLTSQLKKDILKNELAQHPKIENISFTQYYPGERISHWTTPISEGGENTDNIRFALFDADPSFLEMTKIKLVEGQLFSDTLSSDENKALINRAFVKEYEIQNPLDIKIPNFFASEYNEVIGVIEDFHYESKGQAIGPLVIRNSGGAFYCLVQVSSNQFTDLRSTVEFIKEKTGTLSPDFPVEISFMDLAVEQLYQSEIQFKRIFTFFAICAIFISCMGILALSLFTSQQRTKEIGIRKVNGAHIKDILYLLNKDLLKWVAIAFIISMPISWITMNKWLENFAYKTEKSWWIFILGGMAALCIALFTVSWQSWKAARRNPIEALRYE